MGVEGVKRLAAEGVFDDHQIAVEIVPRAEFLRRVVSGVADRSGSGGQDRRPAAGGEFDAVMGFAAPAEGGAVGVGTVNNGVFRWVEWTLEQESPLYDTKTGGGVAGDGRFGRGGGGRGLIIWS